MRSVRVIDGGHFSGGVIGVRSDVAVSVSIGDGKAAVIVAGFFCDCSVCVARRRDRGGAICRFHLKGLGFSGLGAIAVAQLLNDLIRFGEIGLDLRDAPLGVIGEILFRAELTIDFGGRCRNGFLISSQRIRFYDDSILVLVIGFGQWDTVRAIGADGSLTVWTSFAQNISGGVILVGMRGRHEVGSIPWLICFG